MLESQNLAAWMAVAISGFAALLIVLWAGLAIRGRRASARRLGTLLESTSRSERLLAAILERAETETGVVRGQVGRPNLEARRLRALSRLGTGLDLDTVAREALEYVTEELGADGGVALLGEREGETYAATFGLSAAESERELLRLPPGSRNDARAVTILYRYSSDEIRNDAFPLTAGLAVPLEADAGRIGTLAVFWRRAEREPADDEVASLRELAGLLVGPIESARRYEEARRLAAVDPVTGLQNERYVADRLAREVARARRYERRLTLLLFRVHEQTGLGSERVSLESLGRRVRSTVRSGDIAGYLGEAQFAVILPEVGIAEAEHLHKRLEFAVGSGRDGGRGDRAILVAASAELRPNDTPESLLQRASAKLSASAEPHASETAPAGSVS